MTAQEQLGLGELSGGWHMEAVYEQIEELQQAAKLSVGTPLEDLYSDAADMALWLIAERDGLREANRKLHRRAQVAEAVSQSTVDQLASWLTYLAYPSKHRRRQDRYLVQWIVRDVKRVAEKLQARTALLNTKENDHGER